MTPITDDDWARMSWYQRQRYLNAQDRERRFQIEQDRRDRKAYEQGLTAEATRAEAERILDNLDPDPDASRHLAELEAAIATRTAA